MKLVAIVIECHKCRKMNRLVISNSPRGKVRCGYCESILLEFAVVNGFVYALSNPAMPGLLKVGCTQRSVEDRVKEFNAATGTPAPFTVEAYFASQNPSSDERDAHKALSRCRVPEKEFFKIQPKDGIELISEALGRRPIFMREY